MVIQQRPSPNTPVQLGSPVDLVIEASVLVPNVIGMRKEEAVDLLQRYRFNIGQVTQKSTCRGRIETVVEQYPAPNTPAQLGSYVGLAIEAGILVPDVIGKQQKEAINLLRRDKLKVGKITRRVVQEGKADRVIAQNPSSYTSVACGSSVDLVISVLAPRPKPTPAPRPTPPPTPMPIPSRR
ncbi:MAG: PASTA domain-containing protein [Nitrososphaera sp.]|nr:PASTA domain-containing protein [Nitrososphaera sp.]